MSKAVLSKLDAEKIVVSYNPRKFPSVVTPTASDFVAYQSSHAEDADVKSFRIDKIVAQQTGVAELERMSLEEKVEREALIRLKDLQEQAYQQAYQLGLEEGRERAYAESHSDINAGMESFETLLGSIENLKSQLVGFNETHLVRLAFYMAKRIAMDEIADRRDLVLTVVKQAIESAQSEESVTVRLSPADLTFVEEMKERLGKDFESLKRAKLESSDDIRDGGCIVETNYGNVDATIEQRIEKLWDAIAGKLPKVKDVAEA